VCFEGVKQVMVTGGVNNNITTMGSSNPVVPSGLNVAAGNNTSAMSVETIPSVARRSSENRRVSYGPYLFCCFPFPNLINYCNLLLKSLSFFF
jgi:hypothetical protein